MASRKSKDVTVLVVEDAETVRKMVCAMLLQQGYQVVEAVDGGDALRVIQSGAPICLVVTDLVMPGMNGTELARRLAEIAPKLPVIFMSGFADSPVAAECASRHESFLAKPFTAQQLVKKVQQALR